MKHFKSLVFAVLFGMLFVAYGAQAADTKRGRVYYRMVCTVCHMDKAGGALAPSLRTKAEWGAYLQADKHAKGKDSVKYYMSQQYRASIKATNKAAEKYAAVPDADLFEDIKAFVLSGAKDSDTPTSCE